MTEIAKHDGRDVVVIGGGIAGVTCAETLSTLSEGALRVTLVSVSDVLKVAVNTIQISRTAEYFDLQEQSTSSFDFPGVRVVKGEAKKLEVYNESRGKRGRVVLSDEGAFGFDACCVASGARPFVPEVLQDEKLKGKVLTVRDTDSVEALKKKIGSAKKVVVVGNGGIALELVNELSHCDVVWAVKDKYVGRTFFDERTSQALTRLARKRFTEETGRVTRGSKEAKKRNRPVIASGGNWTRKRVRGAGVGPNWLTPKEKPRFIVGNSRTESLDTVRIRGISGDKEDAGSIEILYGCEVTSTVPETSQRKGVSDLQVRFTNGLTRSADVVVSATGVVPNVEWLAHSPLAIDHDEEVSETPGGVIVVAGTQATSCAGVYAAGDCTSVKARGDEYSRSEINWFQMRLWSQARVAGRVAARSIVTLLLGEDMEAEGLEYEMFAHATQFFGIKVVLLGRYNAQGLNSNFRMLEKGGDDNDTVFVRAVVSEGRLRGAVLLGETGLEDTYENLILDELIVEHLGSELVDPSIDLEDYFD